MANETQLQASLSNTRSGSTITGASSISITQTGTANIANMQTIGTTTEALLIGDITDLGYVFVKNTDVTNFVMIGITTAVTSANAMITLLPGEFAVFPTRLEVIYALADTAACAVQVVALSR